MKARRTWSLQRRLARQANDLLAACCVGICVFFSGGASAGLPGPKTIIQCPGSEELRYVPSFIGGTAGDWWSDGYLAGPRAPEITRCTDDGSIFWVSSAQVVGHVSHWPAEAASAPPAWTEAPAIRFLRADEFLTAIDHGLGDTSWRLIGLRQFIWHEANHANRGGESQRTKSGFPAGSAARANLEALVVLLDESDAEQLFIKAEALRELGRFDVALRLINSDRLKAPAFQARMLVVKQAILKRDARVLRIRTGH